MADIRLAKPAAGASESVQCAPEARFVFDFPTTDATLARDGDNLTISFEDGGRLQLEGFYQEYNGENLPSFNIDGTEVAATDFFAAMNEPDLMPAAGPTTGTVANGARFHEWGDSSLTAGIDHLTGLDWGFSRAFEWDDVPNAVGRNGDDWGWWGASDNDGGAEAEPADNPVSLIPENPVPVPPGTEIPGGEPGNAGIVPPGDVRVVSEAGLRDAATVSVNGAMLITAPDGLASIEIGGRVIWQNGHMVGDPQFATDEGYFHNFAYDAASGRLTYTYTLTDATQEHSQPGQDHIAHTLPITVRDADGDAATSSITIVIRDDTPEIAKPVLEAGEDAVHDAETGIVVENAVQDTAQTITLNLDGLTLGADHGDGTSVPEALTVQVAGQTFIFTISTDEAGNYNFGGKQPGADGSGMEITGDKASGYQLVFTRPAADVQPGNDESDSVTSDNYTFNITVKDADGDLATTTQTIKTNVTPDVGDGSEEEGDGPHVGGLKVSDVTVDESLLARGTSHQEGAPAAATGTFSVDTHGEGGTLVLSFPAAEAGAEPASITILLDGHDSWISPVYDTIETKFGTLTVTNVHEGKVEYTYTLKDSYGEHETAAEGDAGRDTMEDVETINVKLIDNIGHDQAEGTLGVNIVDDVPEISEPVLLAGDDVVHDDETGSDVENAVQDTAQTITLNLDGLRFGADDGEVATLSVEVAGQTFTFHVSADEAGNYSFGGKQPGTDGSGMEITGDKASGYQLVFTRPAADVQPGNGESDSATSDTYTFNITVKDADGDIATTTQTITTNVTPDVGDGSQQGVPGIHVSHVKVSEAHLEPLGNKPNEGARAQEADAGQETITDTATQSFTVSTHGEGGTLELSFGGETITINLDANDNWVVLNEETGQWEAPGQGALPTLTTAHGILTVTGASAGTVTYSYQLTSPFGEHETPAEGDAGRDTKENVETINVKLIDNIGHDKAEGTLGVDIVDDIPVIGEIAFEHLMDNPDGDTSNYISDAAKTVSGTLTGLSIGADADGGTVTLAVARVSTDENGVESVKTTDTVTYKVQVTENESGGKVVKLVPQGDNENGAPALKFVANENGDLVVDKAGLAFEYTRNEGEINNNVNETYRFTTTVVDKDGDTATTSSDVAANQAPNFFTPGDEVLGPNANVADSTVHESMLKPEGSEHGESGAATSHEGSFGIDTHGEGGSVTFTWEGQTLAYDLDAKDTGAPAKDDDGNPLPTSITSADGAVTFEIKSISGGIVKYEVTLNNALTDKETDPADLWNTIDLANVKVKLTDSVNHDVAEGAITLKVVDDAPVFTDASAIPDEPNVMTDPIDHLHFDFTQMTEKTINLGEGTKVYRYGKVVDSNQEGSPWFIVSSSNSDRAAGYITSQDGNFALTATFVHYQYTQEGDGTLTVRNIVDLNNGIYNAGKSLSFTGEGGLSVGGGSATSANYFPDAWNGKGVAGEISVGDGELTMTQGGEIAWNNGTAVPDKRYKLVNQYGGEDEDYNTISGANVSEAVVFDLKGDVAFGFNVELKNMAPGDRVLLTFMMTPKNSDDDVIVKMIEYDPEDPYIAVPDGFSKVIISSVPKGDKYTLDENGLWATSQDENQEVGSGFTIGVVDFYKALYEAHGTVEAHSADGIASYTWDWSGIDGKMVHVNGTNSGDYLVSVDEKTGTATLSGKGTLNGKELFTSTINNDGDWSVSLKYEFTLNEPGEPFKILANEGGDGDSNSQVIQLTPKFNRFSEMLAGHSTDKTDIAKDLSDDRIGGQDGNSLIFGKGGDDILLGDKLTGSYDENLENQEVKEVLDELLKVETGTLFGKNTTLDGKADPTNDAFIQKVSDLSYAQKRELGEQLEKLENKVDGGDDAIYGGLGNDFIFAGAGDDVILGYGQKNPWVDDDADIIYAGSGNDIIFYNDNAHYINGGSGTNLLLGNKDTPSLQKLKETEKVDNVEVLIKTRLDSLNSLSITSHAALLTYGVVLGENAVRLDKAMWDFNEETGIWEGKEGTKAAGLTLETTAEFKEYVVSEAFGAQSDAGTDTQSLEGFAVDEVSAPLYGDEAASAGSHDAASGQDATSLMFAAAGTASAPDRAAPEAGSEEEVPGQAITGTDADEVLTGTDGDDFIDGGAGSDTIHAGAGDDLIVYDPTDYLIDGGSGIDFLLSDGQGRQYTLAEMLENYRDQTDADKPMVNDVEVMIKGVDTAGLQNMDALAAKYGFSLGKDANGRDVLILGEQWKEVEGSANGVTTTYENGDGVTLETTLQSATESEPGEQAAQTIVLSSNG